MCMAVELAALRLCACLLKLNCYHIRVHEGWRWRSSPASGRFVPREGDRSLCGPVVLVATKKLPTLLPDNWPQNIQPIPCSLTHSSRAVTVGFFLMFKKNMETKRKILCQYVLNQFRQQVKFRMVRNMCLQVSFLLASIDRPGGRANLSGHVCEINVKTGFNMAGSQIYLQYLRLS
jgi:hypothetical protein